MCALVTGVQTCALPICSGQLAHRMRVACVRMHGGEKAGLRFHPGDPGAEGRTTVERKARLGRAAAVGEQRDVGDGVTLTGDERSEASRGGKECQYVWISVVAEYLKKQKPPHNTE